MIMNDTTREYIEKNTYINAVVCNLLRLGGSLKGKRSENIYFQGGLSY